VFYGANRQQDQNVSDETLRHKTGQTKTSVTKR
jgi:hypothetical protein